MINLKAFQPTDVVAEEKEGSMFDLVEAVLTMDSVLAETGELITSAETVEEIKESITGREIDGAILAYAGESIGQIAPSFVTGDSDEAVEQMEEGLKEFGKSVMDLIKKIFAAIGNFFKKILPFLRGTEEKIDGLLKKFEGKKVSWKKDEGEITVYENIKDLKINIDTVLKILEDVLEVVSKGEEIKGPDAFKEWPIMRVIGDESGQYSKETIEKITKKTTVKKSEKSADSVVADAKLVKDLSETYAKLNKLVPKIEKFVKKKMDELKYNKDAFKIMSPVKIIQALAKVSRTYVGAIGSYYKDTLVALKQINIEK